ncbi:MAG TPA: methyltransferase domain-containing protein, partial [Thermomicrobiales bacterium]|nr:methyltransferase domain-containing protein [Thermomicrobiales bacterium]
VMFDELARMTGIGPGSRVLEIGAGTGIATRELARRKYDITAVEPGLAMAAIARSHAPRVHFEIATFEKWSDSYDGEPFDLVFSATAFHWLDRETRYARCARLLKRGGHLATLEYTHVDGGDRPFFAAAQACYVEHVPGTPEGQTLPPWDAQPDTTEIIASPEFDLVGTRQIYEEIPSTRTGYLALIDTYSPMLALDDEHRNRLYDCLGTLIDRDYDGKIRKAYRHELLVARRH